MNNNTKFPNEEKPIVDLSKFRKRLKISQAVAASRIEIDQRQWSRYEHGENDIPTRYLKRICKEFKVSADYLLGISEESKLYDEIETMLNWAEYQGHISENAKEILLENIDTIFIDIKGVK